MNVEWVLGPYQYRALLALRGDRGSARVEYYEGTVVQDLSFQQLSDGRGAFVGSNVQILAGTGGYEPDAFILERSGRSGEPAFTLACDVAANVCAPLRVLRSAPAGSLLQ